MRNRKTDTGNVSFLRRRLGPEGGAWLRRGAQAQPSVGRVFGRLRGEAGGSAAPRMGVGGLWV